MEHIVDRRDPFPIHVHIVFYVYPINTEISSKFSVMLFIIIFNWTCFWLLIKWVFLIKWFMLEQSLSTLLISVDWNGCFFFLNGLSSHTFNIYWCLICALLKGSCYSGSLSFSLSFWFSQYFFLYIFLPFPQLTVIQITYVNFVALFHSPQSCFSLRHHQIQILFHFLLVYFSWELVLWHFGCLTDEFTLKTFIERSREVLSMFFPPDGWTQSQAIQIHFSSDPQYQHFQYCVQDTQMSG